MTLGRRRNTSGIGPGTAGFSLLEILVALSVMVVGMTSILVLFAVGVTTHKRSIDQMNGALAAETIVSELRARYTLYRIQHWKKTETRRQRKKKKGRRPLTDKSYLADVPGPGRDAPAVPNFPGYHYRVTYTRLDDAGNAVLAEVVILWKKKGEAVSETYVTVLLKKPF